VISSGVMLGAKYPGRGPLRVVHRLALVEVDQLPAEQQEAEIEGERDVVRPHAVAHRRHRPQIRPQVGEVPLGHPGVPAVRKHRVVMAAVRRLALDHGAAEVLEAPGPDAGLLLRRDVGHVESAELSIHAPAAGQEGAVVRMIGVAAVAGAGVKHVLAAQHRLRIGLRRGRRAERREQKPEQRR
jgi:hypothetical protein